MRKWLLLAPVVLLALMPVTVSAQGDPAMKALDWLESQQAEDGSFANGDVYATAAAATALALLERPNEAALTWLETNAPDSLDTLDLNGVSVVLLAALANQADPTTFANGIFFEALGSLMNDPTSQDSSGVCLGAIALTLSGESLPQEVLDEILSRQNEDGGFPATPGEISFPLHTGVCLQLLVSAGETEAVEKSIAYLQESQQEDGGWALIEQSDAASTTLVLMGLLSAGEDISTDWSSAVGFLFSQQDSETGKITALPETPDAESLNVGVTSYFALVFRGLSYSDILPDEETAVPTETEEGPALDSNWAAIQDGFGMDELDTADDFFVTVIDPFTNEELYGVEIINWVAEYQYTGYIIERFLPAEVLLWMNEQDPTTFENISDATLTLLPDDVLAELPAELQARAGE